MSPRTPDQFEMMREEKKNLIMDTALEHFSNQGFQATTINHIAKHAGISKGLMYNYFKSKEYLLTAIMDRSVTEIYGYFNPDHDSQLTPEEFELFIRKVFKILHEKKQFWKLLFRIMMQPGVYEKLFGKESGSLSISGQPFREYTENMMSLLVEYFRKKGENAAPDYDPMTDLLMFINAIKGFAITSIFSEEQYQGEYFEKVTDALIKRYK
ncbi:MAG: TetR/AcrR family transcriptional regulator [Bacteroidales bacterium]|jgi:AcrR family transcriptional regulator|nr:TetR/AcrR family transcriptional regulator [Bacteroidales bacterium]